MSATLSLALAAVGLLWMGGSGCGVDDAACLNDQVCGPGRVCRAQRCVAAGPDAMPRADADPDQPDADPTADARVLPDADPTADARVIPDGAPPAPDADLTPLNAYDRWVQRAWPVMEGRCQGCHRANGAVPMPNDGQFTLTEGPAEEAAHQANLSETASYSDVANPDGSVLLERATGIFHPLILSAEDADYATLRAWMSAIDMP